MSQVNFYVPDELEAQIKVAAKRKGKSVSAFLADLVKANFTSKKWNDEFFTSVLGNWAGDIPEIKRPKSQKRDEL